MLDAKQYTKKKALGQHFLKDNQAIRRIVETLPRGASALEIGPGAGALTHVLLARVGRLTVIEKDDRFALYWQGVSASKPTLAVIHGDVMEQLGPTIAVNSPDWIVGNLPYNISGPLTAQLAGFSLAGGMVLMYQREVAARIAADAGTKTYGRLSVLARHFYDVKRLMTLPPGAFAPPPKVHSSVLLLTPHHHAPPCDFTDLQQTVRHGFAHRRKTISNNFRGLLSSEDFVSIDIDPRLRPEQLDYAAWTRITLIIHKYRVGETNNTPCKPIS